MTLTRFFSCILLITLGQMANAQSTPFLSDTIVHIERVDGEDDLQTIINSDELNNLPVGTEVRFFNGIPVTQPPIGFDTTGQTIQTNAILPPTNTNASIQTSIDTSSNQIGVNPSTSGTGPGASGNSTKSPDAVSTIAGTSISKSNKTNTRSSSSKSRSSSSRSKTQKKRKRRKAPKWNAFSKSKKRNKSGCRY